MKENELQPLLSAAVYQKDRNVVLLVPKQEEMLQTIVDRLNNMVLEGYYNIQYPDHDKETGQHIYPYIIAQVEPMAHFYPDLKLEAVTNAATRPTVTSAGLVDYKTMPAMTDLSLPDKPIFLKDKVPKLQKHLADDFDAAKAARMEKSSIAFPAALGPITAKAMESRSGGTGAGRGMGNTGPKESKF